MREKPIGDKILLVYEEAYRMGGTLRYAFSNGSEDYYADRKGNVYKCTDDGPVRLVKPNKSNLLGNEHWYITAGGKKIPVAQIRAKAFFGDKTDGKKIVHIDGNPANDRLENIGIDRTRTWKGSVDVKVEGKGKAKKK